MGKLFRQPDKGYLGGVCFGIAKYTHTDPIIWRVLAVFTPSLLIYIVLWILLEKGTTKEILNG